MPLWAKIYWVVAIALFGLWVWRRLQSHGAEPTGPARGGSMPVTSPTSPEASPLQASPGTSATIQPLGPGGASTADRDWPAPPPLDPHDHSYRLDPAEAQPTPRGDDAFDGTDRHLPGVAGSDPSRATRATLPELLAGMTLPHELVPLTQVDTAVDLATHVVVATRKAPAEVVAEGLTAELERLGYEVQRPTMTELVAHGPPGRVRVVIHPDGSHVHDAGVRRFPTAEDRTVVVELFAD